LQHQQTRKIAFYLRGFLEHACVPKRYYRSRLAHWLELADRYDAAEINQRLAYYNQLEAPFNLPPEAVPLHRIPRKKATYLIDFRRILRHFPSDARTFARFGDITTVSAAPSFVKTRPIEGPNANSVLLRLNSIRHFRPISDSLTFRQKKDSLVWRGKVKPNHRSTIFKQYFGHPRMDLGMTNARPEPELQPWRKPYLSIREQLQHKFILSVEGNDVATNLKWIAQSNSLCLMARPRFESWFMEGTLRPGIHYVEVRDDYADLPEKINYYLDHPEAAEAIIQRLQAHHNQFTDPKKEQLISLLVAQKYLQLSGQLD
jgi:hypothetical protein